MTRRRSSIEAVRDAIRTPGAVDQVIQALYPDAERDPSQDAWFIGAVEGGRGRSCRFDRQGAHAGRFKDFNPSAATDSGDLIDAVQRVRGSGFTEALTFLGDFLGVSPHLAVVPRPRSFTTVKPGGELKPAAAETLRKNAARLDRTAEALAYLHARGLTQGTIEHFRMGLAAPYPFDAPVDEQVGPVIVTPTMGADGGLHTPMPKTTVPGLTRNPRDEKGWCHGPPRSTWSDASEGRTILFVAEGMKDLWRLWQEVEPTSLGARMAIVSSTHGSGMPAEWKEREFWLGWDTVYLGHDNDAAGEAMAARIRGHAGRDVLRVEVPRARGKDWTDFFQDGGTLVEFEELLAAAKPMSSPLPSEAEVDLEKEADGVYAVRPINVNGAFHQSRMYYPYRVRRTQTTKRRRILPDGTPISVEEKQFRFETMVVRSDGVSLGVRTLPAPPGTPDEDRIRALDDSTIIVTEPKPGEFATWDYHGICDFVDAVRESRATHRPLGEIVADVMAFLERLTWLPVREDHALIAAYVVMSYCYNVFDAIPQLLLNGEKGSGKSTTAEGIADLGYNGYVLGAGSEKAMVRFVDQGRGLLVLDDLEKVGRRGADDGGFADINQILKLSYSKAAAKKTVVEKTGASRVLDFYGPKVITNISGIDAVNATRMFKIMCRPMPTEIAEGGQIRGRDTSISEPLRQELHAWGMANAAAVHRTYRTHMESLGRRDKQIAAPLLVIAGFVDDEEFSGLLHAALDRQTRSRTENASAEDFLRIAVEEAIARGAHAELSVPQLRAELAMIPETMITMKRTEVPEDLVCLHEVRWISQALAGMGVRRSGEVRKLRLYGNLVRVYDLDPDYVRGVIEDRAERGLPTAAEIRPDQGTRRAFAHCEGRACGSCPYALSCGSVDPWVQEAKKKSMGGRGRR